MESRATWNWVVCTAAVSVCSLAFGAQEGEVATTSVEASTPHALREQEQAKLAPLVITKLKEALSLFPSSPRIENEILAHPFFYVSKASVGENGEPEIVLDHARIQQSLSVRMNSKLKEAPPTVQIVAIASPGCSSCRSILDPFSNMVIASLKARGFAPVLSTTPLVARVLSASLPAQTSAEWILELTVSPAESRNNEAGVPQLTRLSTGAELKLIGADGKLLTQWRKSDAYAWLESTGASMSAAVEESLRGLWVESLVEIAQSPLFLDLDRVAGTADGLNDPEQIELRLGAVSSADQVATLKLKLQQAFPVYRVIEKRISRQDSALAISLVASGEGASPSLKMNADQVERLAQVMGAPVTVAADGNLQWMGNQTIDQGLNPRGSSPIRSPASQKTQ